MVCAQLCSLRRHGPTIGWIVTYMIHVRHGGPSSGYISTGFFGGKHAIINVNKSNSNRTRGLTVGRVAFLWVNKKVSLRANF